MAATPAASVIVQLHYVRSESLYRLVPSVTQLKWTETGYDVSSVSLTVSHVSGASTASLAYADWSKHGLSVSRIIKMPGQQPLPGVVMTSGTWTLGKSRYDYLQFQLKKDGVVIDTVTIGVYSDGGKGDTGDAAVSYEMMLSPDNLHFDADGVAGYDIKTTAYKVTGGTRTLVKSNTDGVGFLCLYGTKSDGSAVPPMPIASTSGSAAMEINNLSIKDELFKMYLLGARNIELRLQGISGNPLAVRSIPILRDGGRGLKGATSVPPGLWDEYGDEYEFQDGVTAADGVTPATRLDTVALLNGDNSLNLYMCVHSHKKKDGIKDSKGNLLPPNESSYWKASETQGSQFISTRVFLSNGAYIGLMSTNGIQLWETLADGTRQIVGEIRGGRDIGKDYTIWVGGYKDDDGVVYPQWAVDGTGKHYIGSKTGQRIELDPVQKAMKVYDGSGKLVATHSGEWLDPATVVPSASLNGADNGSASVGFGSVTTQGSKSTTKVINHTAAVTASGVLEVTVPGISVTVTPNGSGGSTSMGANTRATLTLVVEVNGTVRLRETLGSVDTVSAMTGTVTKVIDSVTRTVRISKGEKYKVTLELSTSITGGSGSGGSVQTSVSTGAVMTANLIAEFYQATYGGNGFVIAVNSRNYLYALVDADNVLRLKGVSNGKTVFSS